VISFRTSRARLTSPAALGLLGLLVILGLASTASAEYSPGWGRWWLPPDRSTHGHGIDSLFYWIFWITMIIFILCEVVLVIFLIKYRSRPDRKKAHFTHGNPRLEMAWTIAPAIILAFLALFSKKVWDQFRYAPEDPNRAKVLVIGEQFKWNVIYPGPDGKFGKYLLYPKPTDAKWPVGADGKDVTFQGVPGPASLPYDKAMQTINMYIGAENPLGKDNADPDGKDDNLGLPGRILVLPAHRQVEVQLGSKDVIHDFFLPNHRVKLDAVPGMRGKLHFTATMTSAERRKEGVRTVPLDQLPTLLAGPGGSDTTIVIDETAPGAEPAKNQDTRGWRYVGGDNRTIMRHGGLFGDADTAKTRIEALKAAGLTEVKVTFVEDTGLWELVCEELCGSGHNTMHSPVQFLSNEEYDKLTLDKPFKPAPTTGPAIALNQNQ
jgi:heme/copper-type cytochrome/quinol oxidase subunit 2